MPVSGKFHTLFTIAVLMHLGPAIPVQAQFTFSEDFKNDSAPGWTFVTRNTSPGPRLTGGATADAADPETGTLDTIGDGWLRLTTTTGSQANAAYLDTVLPAANSTISVTFDVAMWEGSSADGITFFFYDAAETFAEGAFGGSIGYAQKTLVGGGDESHPGLAAGYLGVGIDAFGNFSNATEGRIGGIGSTPNAVAVRGPGIQGDNPDTGPLETDEWYLGYAYQNGTTDDNGAADLRTIFSDDTNSGVMNFQSATSRPNQTDEFRSIRITLDESDQLKVEMQMGSGSNPGSDFRELFTTDYSGFTRPDELRLGWAGGTGGSDQVAEIRNLLVTASGFTGIWYWDDDLSTLIWGDTSTGSNFKPNTVPGTGLGAGETPDVVFNDQFVSGDQTISVQSGDKTVNNVTFSGQYGYTLNPNGSEKLIFDNGTNTTNSIINVLNNPNGNDDHTIATDIQLNNGLNIDNFVNQTLALSGDVNLQTFDLDVESVGTTTISGIVSGSGDVEKDESGTLILSGTNSYTGSTTVTEGTLRIENSSALGGTGTGTTVTDGTTLAIANGIAVASESVTVQGTGVNSAGAVRNISGINSWGGTISLGGDTTFGSDAGTLTIDGIISESTGSSFTKVGDGTILLGANNTYTGSTTVSAGTLEISDANALGDTSAVTTVSSGGTLALSGNINTPDAETLTLGGSGVSGKAALWAESGDNEWDGTISLSSDATFGANSGAILQVDGVVSGNQSVTIQGDGVVVWKDPMSYTGVTNINSGTLRFDGGDNRIADSSAVTVASGATLDLNERSDTIASLAGAGSVLLGGGGTDTLTTGAANTSTTFSGVISEAGNLTKTGSGTFTLTGSNTYTGSTTINAGTLELANSSGAALSGSTPITVNTGAILLLSQDDQISNTADLTLGGGTITLAGIDEGTASTAGLDTVTVSSSSNINFNGSAAVFSFDNLNITSGTWTVGSWSGDPVTGGGPDRLIVDDLPSAGNLSNIDFDGWGSGGATTTDLGNGFFEIVPDTTGLVFTYQDSADGDWTVDANWSPDPPGSGIGPNAQNVITIFPDTTGSTLTVSLDANKTLGRMIFQGSDDYTIQNNEIDFDVSSGDAEIQVTGSGSPTINSNLDLNSDNLLITQNGTGTLTVSGTVAMGGNDLDVQGTGVTTVSGVISGTAGGDLTKTGTGTLNLSAVNTYVGETTVSGGVLQISNVDALGSTTGDTTVSSGGTLALSGNINTPDGETLTLGGSGVSGKAALWAESGNNNEWDGTIALSSDATFGASSGALLRVDGTISGSQSVTIQGDGIVVWADPMSYTGATNINSGTLQFDQGDNRIANSSAVTVASGATLDLNERSDTIGSLAGAGSVLLGGGGADTLTTGADDTSTTFSGVISEAGNLVKSGTGNFTVSGNNTYTGATTVSAGTLTAQNANALGTTAGATSVTSGATLALDGNGSDITYAAEALTLNGTGVGGNGALRNTGDDNTWQGTVALNADSTVGVDSGTSLDISGIISGANDLTKIGDGTLAFSGSSANTYSRDTNIDGGTVVLNKTAGTNAIAGNIFIGDGSGTDILRLGASDQIANTADIDLDGGQFDLSGNSETVDLLDVNVTSIIDFDSSSTTSDLFFSDSSGVTWGPSALLQIDGYGGSTSGNGLEELEFGSGPGAGITTSQLRQVRFLNFDSGSGSTTHLARFAGGDTKEVVPLAGNEFIWKNSVAGDTGTWDTDANWIAEYYPDNTLARVVFGEDALDANVSVTTGTDTDFNLNRITFRDTADFNVTIDSAGANTLTFDNDGFADPQIKVNSGEDGAYTIGSDIVLKDDLTLDHAGAGLLTLSGDISESGSGIGLVKSGSGTAELSGSNTYAASTTISAGVLKAQNKSALGNTSVGTTVASGATLTLDGNGSNITFDAEPLTITGSGAGSVGALYNESDNNTWKGPIDLSGSASVGAATSTTMEISGVVSGGSSDALTKLGAGAVNLSASNTFLGDVNINAGKLQAENGSAIDNDASVVLANVSGAEFELLDDETVGDLAGGGGTGGDVDLNGNALTTGGSDADTTLSGVISGTGAGSTLAKEGAGNFTLEGSNTYAGTTSVTEGTLTIENANGLGATGAGTTVSSAATLALDGDGSDVTYAAEGLALNGTGVGSNGALRNVSDDNTWQGTVALSTDSSIGVDTGTTLEVSGVVSGGNGLTKVGDGDLTLSGTNTYTGTTTISAGTLIADDVAALGGTGSGTSVTSGATVALLGSRTYNAEGLTLNGDGVGNNGALRNTSGDNTWQGSVALNTDSSIGVDSGTTLDVSGVVSGSNGLTKIGDGSLTLSGSSANTASGTTTVNAGTVILNKTAGTDAIAGNLTIGDGNGTDVVRLNANNQISNGSNITLSGGELEVNGNTDTAGTLDVDATSPIDLAATSLLFLADSSGVAWDPAALLNFENWDGNINGDAADSGTDNIEFASAGLTKAQVRQSRFLNYDSGDGDGARTHLARFSRDDSDELVPVASNEFIWKASVPSGTWDTDGNWLAEYYPDNALARAVFTESGLGSDVTTSGGTDIAFDVNRVTFRDSGANDVTVDSGGAYTLTFNDDGVADPRIQVDSSATGTSILGSAIVLTDNLDVQHNGSGNLTLSGVISETGGSRTVTKEGSGTLELSAGNTYTGTTTISAGILEASNDSSLGTIAGGTTVANGATLALSNNADIAAEALTISGNGVSNRGALRLLSGTSTYDGDITLAANARVRAEASTDLTLSGDINLSNRRLLLVSRANADIELSGVISATGTGTDLVKGGGGKATISGTSPNTFGGLTAINAGTLELNKTAGVTALGGNVRVGSGSGGGSDTLKLLASDQIANGNTFEVRSTGLFDLNEERETIGSLRGDAGGQIVLGGTGTSVLTVTQTANQTYSGIITGTGSLVKNGANTLTLDGVNTFTGGTTIDAGTLQVDNGSAIADTASVSLANTAGAVFVLLASETIGDLSGGGSTGGNVDVNATTLTTGTAAGSTYAGSITGSGNLIKQGSGTMELQGTNAFTGTTTISNGVLRLDNSGGNALDATTTVTISGGSLLFDRPNQVVDTADLVLAGGTFNSAGFSETMDNLTLTATSTIDLGSGASILDFSDGTRTAGTFRVEKWSGNISVGGGTDQIKFAASLDQAFLDNIFWVDQGITGAIQLPSGEIVPVPEPSTVIGGIFLGLVVSGDIYRRYRQRRRRE